jgi:hypothetical protein
MKFTPDMKVTPVETPADLVNVEGPDGSSIHTDGASKISRNPMDKSGWWRSPQADRLLLETYGSAINEDFFQVGSNMIRRGTLRGLAEHVRFLAEKRIFEKVARQDRGEWDSFDERAHTEWLQRQCDWWLWWAAEVIKEHGNVREVFQKSLEFPSGNSRAVTDRTLAELNLNAVLQLDDEVKP